MSGAAGLVLARDLVVGAHRLHVNTSGDPAAPPVLWLHGSGPGVSALSNWEPLLRRFRGRFLNVAPDILGFAASSHPDPAPVGLREYTRVRAEVALDLLDALGLDRAHVVGNSMGGMIALTMAGLAPERLDRIVLMGSGGAPVPPTPSLIEMVRYYDDPTPAAMRALLTSFVHDPALFGDRLEEIAADRAALANRPEIRRSHLATFDVTGGPVALDAGYLAALPHETLVIHGREDRLIPVEASSYLQKNLPNARLLVLPHAGHWVQLEAAERFAAALDLFLAGGL